MGVDATLTANGFLVTGPSNTPMIALGTTAAVAPSLPYKGRGIALIDENGALWTWNGAAYAVGGGGGAATPVVDNLLSTVPTAALSAKQGNVLASRLGSIETQLAYPEVASALLIDPTHMLLQWTKSLNPDIAPAGLFGVTGHTLASHTFLAGRETMLTLGEDAGPGESLLLAYTYSNQTSGAMRDIAATPGFTESFANRAVVTVASVAVSGAGGAVNVAASTVIDLTKAGPAYAFMALRHTVAGEALTVASGAVEDGGCKFALYGADVPNLSAFVIDNDYAYDPGAINVYFATYAYGQAHLSGLRGAAVDVVSPHLVAANVSDGSAGFVTVTTDEAIDAAHYSTAQFAVSGKTITSIARIDATHFRLGVTPAFTAGQSATLSATQTGVDDMRDVATPSANLLANLSGLGITNALTPPPVFTAQSAPAGIIGTPYSYQFAASNAVSYARTSGVLPPGLVLSAAGLLSGTPTAVGSSTFVVTASGVGGSTASASQTTVIADGFADDFNAADGTALTAHPTSTGGKAWSVKSGNWSIQSNQAQASGAAGLAMVDSGHSDGTFTVQQYLSADNPYFVFRGVDENNYWAVRAGSYTGWRVELWMGGSKADEWEVYNPGFPVYENVQISVQLNGNAINLTVTDATMTAGITLSDARLKTATMVGMRQNEAGTTTWDNPHLERVTMSQASNLLRALQAGGSSGTIGGGPVVLNLGTLGLDVRPWFLGVEAASDCTIAVELSFDAGSTYYPASPATVALGDYENYTFMRSPGELYPNRVRLTRTAGAAATSTYAIGPVVAQSVVALGRHRRIVVNAPGRDIALSDVGGVLHMFGASNSTLRLPASGSALLGGKSWLAGGSMYPSFAMLRVGDGEVFLQPELDGSNLPLVQIDPGSADINDKLLTLCMMVDTDHWVLT